MILVNARNNKLLQNEIKVIKSAYLQYFKRLMIFAADKAKKRLLDNKNYATSQLIQSISGGAEIQGDMIIGSFGANTKYAYYVEFGRKPGKMPPLQPIVAWLERKTELGHMQIDYQSDRTGKFMHANIRSKNVNQFYESQNAIRGVAFLIARSIANKGSKAHPYLSWAKDLMMQKFNSDMPLPAEANDGK